ncbi:SDR family oxidoreductase [Peribacillus sp. SCS-155]|uniref:SDR family oxidoreductase n=1 Tax=Peribacillus sedimenti TaxID=3115297 RepID=UPI0039063B44
MKLQGKVAIVSGAGSGIGKAAAIKLAAQGAKVCILDLKEKRAQKVVDEISGNGGIAFAMEVDVSEPDQVKRATQEAVERWGRLDIVFANAGINGTLAPIEELSPDEWDKTVEINLKGTFLLTQSSIPHLKKNGGSIIITSSINGNRVFSNIGMSAYSTSKAGQVAFMKMAALELARYKIRVNAICPGAIETNIGQNTHPTDELNQIKIPVDFPEGNQPLEGGPGSPEQVAKLVLFLASDDSSHISGTEIYIDGTESLLQG